MNHRPDVKVEVMRELYRPALVQLGFAILLSALLNAQDGANTAIEKFHQDLKTAVLNGGITAPQVEQLKADAETLKNARSEQTPESPVDLLTPWRAVSSMKKTMTTVDAKDRETLRQDLQAVIASKKQPASGDPPTAGQKLGKDIFKAVLMGDPTEAQVQQLQDSLNELKAAKGNQGHPLQALHTLNNSKSQIESVMKAGQFRPEDQQAVLDDLNSLGPHGGSGTRR